MIVAPEGLQPTTRQTLIKLEAILPRAQNLTLDAFEDGSVSREHHRQGVQLSILPYRSFWKLIQPFLPQKSIQKNSPAAL